MIMRSKQSGFTLVEIAIVLVIIGLLLGGVLKGQELINSAKVKNFATDFRNVPLFIYGYQDKFRKLPGDMSATDLGASMPGVCLATGLECRAAATVGTAGNGIIEGNWYDVGGNTVTAGAAVDSEAARFWQHVRAAGFASGPTDWGNANYRPLNADGGPIGFETGVNMAVVPPVPAPFIAGMTGTYYVCTDGILGKFAKQLDATLDNDETSTGSVRAVPTGSARGAAATTKALIVDSATYIVCMAL
jgi:prepilin-type N-terminal cleavage/methylation domain-containing protein